MWAVWTRRSCWTARSPGGRHPVTRAWRWYPQSGDLVNRFFRSALFPLVIIAALVWLALQTLGHNGKPQTAIQTSQFIQAVHDVKRPTSPSQVSDVTIDPNKQSISATVTDPNLNLSPPLNNSNVTVHYATDQSEFAIEQAMKDSGVTFNAKGIGSPPWRL